MPRCYYHPDVETGLSCTECGRPICPKEMISTPVGHKCPEHGKPKRGQYTFVKPSQLAWAAVAGVGAGVGGGIVLGFTGFGGFWFMGLIWGALTAEAVRKASGGHRGTEVGIIAGLSLAVGGLLGLALGMWPLTPIIAIFVALAQLAVIGR